MPSPIPRRRRRRRPGHWAIWAGAAALVAAALLGSTTPAATAAVAVPSSDPDGAAVLVVLPTLATPTSIAPESRGRWRWPLVPRPVVARAFVAPGSAWGAGHRGLDLLGRAGGPVLAVEDGVVSHVGVVAGRGTVTVLHRDGLRSTYEPVDAAVRLGASVQTGEALGTLAAAGWHCTSACLHLGARRGGDYLDPEPLLLRPRIVLLPLP